MERPVRRSMETALGSDFGNVRVHTDSRAARAADTVNAAAFTVGSDVVFGANRYAPTTPVGQRLLAHELVHVQQQKGSMWVPGSPLGIELADSRSEREAEERSSEAVRGRPPSGRTPLGSPRLQRQDAPIDDDRDVDVQPTIRPDNLSVTLEVLRGRRLFTVQGGITQPLNLLGTSFPGIPPSQVSAALRFDDRCNSAFQNAVLNFQQNQRRGGPLFDLGQNRWRVGASVGYRSGSVRFEPGVQLGFDGSTADTVLFTLNIVTAVDPTIPPECIAPPASTRPTPDPDGGPRRPPPDRGGGGGGIAGPSPGLETANLNFFYDSTLLRPESEDNLASTVSVLRGVERLQVVLTGHASLEGSERYNLDLGQRRADAIRDRLVLAGIDPSRITTRSLGEAAPIEPEPPLEQRSLLPSVERVRTRNRRVEVTFVDPTGEFAPRTAPSVLRTGGLRRPELGRRPTLGVGSLRFPSTDR